VALYSIRLDDETESALAALARVRKVSRAMVAREAIVEYGNRRAGPGSMLAAFAPLIGSVPSGARVSGRGKLSEKTGQRVAELLARRARRGRKRG
jgi:RNA 3'-terminal phosphate cyclase